MSEIKLIVSNEDGTIFTKFSCDLNDAPPNWNNELYIEISEHEDFDIEPISLQSYSISQVKALKKIIDYVLLEA